MASEIKSFGGLQKVTDMREDPEEVLLPCGHSKRQAVLLGCTETACRPKDVEISTRYFAEKLALKGRG